MKITCCLVTQMDNTVLDATMLQQIPEGISPPLNSPIPLFEKDVQEEDFEVEEEIRTELDSLLKQNISYNDRKIPFFMTQSKNIQEKKPTILEKICKFFYREPIEHEAIFPQELLNGTSRTAKSSDQLIINKKKSNRDNQNGLWSNRKASSMDKFNAQITKSGNNSGVIGLEQEETMIENETIMNFKYKECMKQAKTMVNISFAQLKLLLESTEAPVDYMKSGGNVGLFLLPLNELGKEFLLEGRKKGGKISIGRNEMSLFTNKSRVVSRHQSQIFYELNKVTSID